MLVIRKDQLGANDVVRLTLDKHEKINIMVFDTQRRRYVAESVFLHELLPERDSPTNCFVKLVGQMRQDRIGEIPTKVEEAAEEIERSVVMNTFQVYPASDFVTPPRTIPDVTIDTKILVGLLEGRYTFGGSSKMSLKRLINIISHCAEVEGCNETAKE